MTDIQLWNLALTIATEQKHMHSKQLYSLTLKDRGVELASRHDIMRRGKVIGSQYCFSAALRAHVK